MADRRSFRWSDRVRSIGFALRGVKIVLVSQHNAWFHAVGTVIACAAGAALGLTVNEWCWIVISIVVVWTAECLNTAFELLCDVASPGVHPVVEKAKDVAAGSVLVCAIGAMIIGAMIFVPYLIDYETDAGIGG